MAPLSIQIYVVGPVQTNCYFAINDDTKEVLIIDPGASAKQLAEAAGWAAGPARAARPGLLRLFHRQVIPFTAAPRSAHRPQAPTGTHRSGRSRG